ncbi:hypothetical protein Clacol_007148 [Clathrus columnatus]|uniref:GH16 domain-containing protein n=1 Tax=Clathrus columnatus TaxID=1419009 RepID=A0AAV5AE40_9AGAM|nr:hypothetical protein Clacol_007148 [Clathrus columnatus]
MATIPDPFASRPTTPNSSEGEQRSNGYSSSSITSNNGGQFSHLPPSNSSPTYPSPTNEHLRPSHVSSPLNPHSPSRPDSRGSMSRLVSEESFPLGVGPGGYPYISQRDASTNSQRGNMLLYRLASEAGAWDDEAPLPPPTSFRNRFSTGSESGLSIHSTNSDSKYPSERFLTAGKGAFLAYPYDPSQDQMSPPDADDLLHDPKAIEKSHGGSRLNVRGFANMFVLATLVIGIVCLFTLYPILNFFKNNAHNLAIDNNVQVNGTGQVPVFPNLRSLVDQDTPDNVKTRTGWDGQPYELVFSDEFNHDGRTFYPGDDPYFEAQDLWYGATEDLEWYSPDNAITANGSLQIVVEQVEDPSTNHGLLYKSAMLQSWNKFCFTTGYIEFNVSLPGQNSNVSGYWPGMWTMGNLGRPGYGASTDGMWPYSYDACDLGTFRNQTNQAGDGPPAALHTDNGRANFNFELSWLPGQRASACTCPGSEHPGPNVGVGRGAPEIDILEAEKNKLGVGGRVSQSAQFAPFSADYAYSNSTPSITVYTPNMTRENSYHGSGLQQAISYLTQIPDDNYAGAGGTFVTYGFEYWSNPNDPTDGFITWSMGGQPTYQMTAAAVPMDSVAQISQRLISREPMSIIMNLAISASFQPVVVQTLTFPAALQIDYVRIYQRTGTSNGVGCDPPGFPTSQYINDHIEAYTNPNLTFWRGDPSTGFEAGYSWPKNSLYFFGILGALPGYPSAIEV